MNQVGVGFPSGFYYGPCSIYSEKGASTMQHRFSHSVPARASTHPALRIGDVFSFAIGFTMTLLVLLLSIALSGVSRLQRPILTFLLLTIASLGLIAMQLERCRRRLIDLFDE